MTQSKNKTTVVTESNRWRAGSRYASAALARGTLLGKNQKTQQVGISFGVD
jgi:hypothetical protein